MKLKKNQDWIQGFSPNQWICNTAYSQGKENFSIKYYTREDNGWKRITCMPVNDKPLSCHLQKNANFWSSDREYQDHNLR